MKISGLTILLLLFLTGLKGSGQTYSLEITLKNQTGNYIILGKIKGDDYAPADTLFLQPLRNSIQGEVKKAEYTFRENSVPGMYQLVLGQTTYAKVMNESPQHIDFIFNKENLIFETDFEKPEERMLVILSEENRIWFEFSRKEKEFQKQFHDLSVELVYYRDKTNSAKSDSILQQNKTKWESTAMKYNAIQKQRSDLIAEILKRNPELYISKLIKMYNEPFLDGFLTNKERKERFQKDFFNSLDFSEESLINSPVYTDKIFKYLTSYNRPEYTKKQLEQEYIKAVDVILPNMNENQKVYQFILNYLVHGFEVLKMEEVLNYIDKKYKIP